MYIIEREGHTMMVKKSNKQYFESLRNKKTKRKKESKKERKKDKRKEKNYK